MTVKVSSQEDWPVDGVEEDEQDGQEDLADGLELQILRTFLSNEGQE